MVELSGIAAFLAAILLVLTLFRLSVLEKRVVTLSRLEGKVDSLLKHAGIAYDPYENLSDDVIRAVQQGEKFKLSSTMQKAKGSVRLLYDITVYTLHSRRGFLVLLDSLSYLRGDEIYGSNIR
jgi:hypothetical protein